MAPRRRLPLATLGVSEDDALPSLRSREAERDWSLGASLRDVAVPMVRSVRRARAAGESLSYDGVTVSACRVAAVRATYNTSAFVV